MKKRRFLTAGILAMLMTASVYGTSYAAFNDGKVFGETAPDTFIDNTVIQIPWEEDGIYIGIKPDGNGGFDPAAHINYYGQANLASIETDIITSHEGSTLEISNVSKINGTYVSDFVTAGELGDYVTTSAHNSAVSALSAVDDALQDQIDVQAGRLTTAEDDIDALEGRMDTAEDDIDALDGRVTAAEADIIENAEAIAQETEDRIAADQKGDVKSAVYHADDGTLELYNEAGDSLAKATDIASKSITEGMIGASDQRQLQERYAQTNYIGQASSLAEADIALDREIYGVNQRLDRTNTRLDRVGAGAAALAALHPLDYDSENKLQFAAGLGNYAGANAAAIGAFYHPNDNVMFSVGSAMGNGENMVNFGVSFGIGGKSALASMNKRELIAEVHDMKLKNEELKQENREIRHELNKLKELVLKLAEKQ